MIDALLSGARPGEVVWDIGANVGLYTMMLARAVTPGGRVYAFEPAPDSAGRIVEHTTANGVENYELFNMALGRERGSLLLSDPEPFSPVRRLLDPGERAEAGVIEGAVETGDDLRASRGLPVPALVKIDVEGAEEGVMLGMRKTLADPACRTLVCEVHFSILAERGDSQAWQRIEQLLRSCGFDQQRWIAQSHLAAQKSAPDGRSNGQQPA